MDTKHTRKEHFKMYKAGKHWLYAAITAFAVTGATAMTADIEDTIGHGWHFGGTHRVSADSNTDATVAKYKPAYFTADGKRTYDKSKAYDGFTFNSIEDAIVGDYKTTPQVSAYTGVTIEVRNAYVRYNTNTQRLEVFLVLKKSTVVAVQNIGYDLVGGWGHRAKKESPNSSSFKNDQFVVNKDKLVSDSSFYVTNGGTRQYLNDLYSSFTSFGSYAISTSYVASYQSSGNSATNGSRTTKEQNYTSKKQLADRLAKITIDKTDIQNEFNNLLEKYLKEVEECSDKSSVNSTENSFKSSFNEISSKITALEQKEAAQKLITTAKSDVTSDGNAYYENLKKILDVSGLSEAEKVSISAAYYQAVEDQANGITGSTSEEVTQSAEAAKQTLKDKYQDAISDAYQQAINAAEKRALNSLSDSEKEKKTSEFDGIVSGKVAAFDKTASVNDVITAITSTNLDNLFKNTEAKADFQKIVERIKEDIKNDPELTSANKIANGKAVQDAANSYSDNLTNNVTSAYAQFKAMQDAEKKLRELAAANRQTLSDAQKDVKKSLDAIYAKAVDEINKDDSLAVVNGTHIDYSARDKQLAVIKELWQRAYGEVDQAKTLDEAYAVISNDGESLKNMHSEKKAAREKLKAKAEKGLSDLEEILKRDRSGKRYVDQTRAKAQAAINADLEKAYNEIDDATFEKISEKISDTSEQLTKDIDAALNKKRYAGNYDATRKNWWNQFVAVRDQAIADLNKRKQDIAQSPYNGNTNLTIGEIDRQIASIMDISQEVWNEIFAKRMPKRTNVKAYDREVKRKGKQAKTYFAVMDKKTVVNGTLKEQMDRVRDISGKKTSARQKVAEAAQAAIKDIENQSATMTSDEMQTVIDGLNKTYDEQVMIIDRMNDAADIDAAGDAASKKITDQKDKDKKAAAKSMADRQSEYAAKIQAAVDAAKSAINHSALSTAEKALQQESVQKAGDAAIDKVKAAHTKVDDLVKDFNEGMATVQGLTNEQNKSRQTLADKAQTAIDKINGESRLKESEKQALIKKVNDALSTYQQAADRTTTIKDAQDAASNADFETLLKDVTNFSNIPNDKQPVVSTDAIAAIKDAVAKAKAQVEADSSLSDDSKRNQKKAIDAAASAAMTNIENAGNDAATVKTAVSNGVDNISKLHDSKNQLHVDAEKAAADARNAVEKEATFSDADKAERKQLIDNALRDYLAVVDGVSDAGSVTAQSASAHGKYVLELAKAQTPGTTFDAIRGEALSKLEAAYNANKPGTSASQAAKDAYETLYSDSKAIINNSKNAQEVKDNLPGALDQLKNINADKDSANASFKERAQKALDDLAASDAPSDQSKQLKETLEKALDAAVDNVDKQTSREGVANAKDNADLDAAIKNSYVHDSLAKIRQDAIDQINDLADYEQSLIDDGIPNPDSEEIVTKESTFSADEKAKQKAYIEEKRNAALEKLNDSSLTTKGEIDKVVEETSQLIDGITEAKQELLDAMTAEHGKAVDAINGNKNLTIAEKKAAIEKLDAAFKAAEAKVSDETDFSKLEGIDTDIEDKDENVLYTTTDYSENPHFKEMKGLLDAVTGAEHASLDNQKNTAAEALRQYAKDEFEKAATEAKLSEAEKVNAKTALDKFVESVISSNIDVVTEAEDIAGALAQSKTAVDNYLDLKKDAYKTIEQAAQDAKNLLNNLAGDASDTNSAKGKAYAEIDKLAENADKTIDDGEGKADDVQSNTQKGVDEIKKAAAGLLVQAAADKANDYIDQLKLNDEDKAQAKENIKNDLAKANTDIDLADASKAADLAQAQVEQIEKDKAKAAIDKAAEEANALIDGLGWDATNAKDQAAKAADQQKIAADVDKAKEKIQAGETTGAIEGARDQGILDIQRDAAKAAIDKAVADAQDKLAKDSNIPAGDKSKAEAALNDAGQKANDKIDGQTDKDAINDAKNNGLNDVKEASQTASDNGQKKADAKQAVKAAADKANDYIDQLKLNDEDKAQAKENIKNDLAKANTDIDLADASKAADLAQAQVEQIEKDKAKAAIDKAAEEANALIDGLGWDATNAKDQAAKAADQQKIAADVDKAKEKIQAGETTGAIEGARDQGILDIQRDAAKAAIDKAVADAQDKLANNDKLTPDVKQEQQNVIDKAADGAKNDIDNAQDKLAIDNAVDNGKNAIINLSNIIVLPTTGGETREPAAVPTLAVSTNSEVVATPTVTSEPARATTTQSETPAAQTQTQTEVPAANEATQVELPKTTDGKKSKKPTKAKQATKSVKEPEHDSVIFNSFLGAVVASLAGWRGFVWFAKKKEEDDEEQK